jgi:hypothetical protein
MKMPYKRSEDAKARRRRYYALYRERIKERSRLWRLAHPEQVKIYNDQYGIKHRVKLNAREKLRYHESARDAVLRRKYGLNEKMLWKILIAQNGGCAICGSTHLLSVDHCHETGVVRGVLCRKCNAGIGQLGDDVDRVERATTYLRAAQTVKEQAA